DARPRLRLPRAAHPLSQAFPDGTVPRAARGRHGRALSLSPAARRVARRGVLVLPERRPAFFEQVVTSRLSTEGRGSSTHFLVYDFIPDVLAQHPLFGLGVNTFSVYY